MLCVALSIVLLNIHPMEPEYSCWQCQQTNPANALFCKHCGALSAPRGDISYFFMLGLEEQFILPEETDLEGAYHARAMAVHPDRFLAKSKQEQHHAQQHTALLNTAYQTLNDPVLRASYLLQRKGWGLPENTTALISAEMMAQQFDLREHLSELNNPAALNKLDKEVETEVITVLAALARAFEKQQQQAAQQATIQLQFLQKFQKEIVQRRAVLFEAAKKAVEKGLPL